MKKILTLSAALMLCASMAMAQGIGLYIGADCNTAAAQTVSNTCLTNSGTAFATFGTCIIPPSGKPNFVGEVSIIDVQTNLATIPDWWRYDACRASGFTLTTDALIGGTNCAATIWDGAVPAGNNIQAFTTAAGARERFVLGAVLYPQDVYDLPGDGATEVAVFKWVVAKAKSVGTNSCAGCLEAACVVLNEVQLQGTTDVSEADYVHLTTPIAGHNFVAYNGVAGSCPAGTPTQNKTWGSVKALYR